MLVKGKKVLVLGLGDTGLSMARWLARQGAVVSVADTRIKPPHAAELARELPQARLSAGTFQRKDFDGADMIAISPGVDRRELEVAHAIARGVPVAGDVELFAQALQQSATQPKVLAITGSNGKSTVTAMAGAICNQAGLNTVIAGNFGLPVLDALDEIEHGKPMPDAFVLELSSFQLESTQSLNADAAAMLNLSEDHMDRYDNYADYAAAKARIFSHCVTQVLNRDDVQSMAMARADCALVTFGLTAPRMHMQSEWGVLADAGTAKLMRGNQSLMPLDELPVAGLHNAANALAAGALCCAIGVDDEAITGALRSFKGLPHRVELINKIKYIKFYDDSKGTNVGATVAALNGMRQPVVLIAGGDGKGQDFSPLAAAVTARARAVVLIGRDAPQIERVLRETQVPMLRATDMAEAVTLAYQSAQAGDAVLLSPACASYDMFRNYVHRAEVFVDEVRALAARAG